METIEIYVDGGSRGNGRPDSVCYGSFQVQYKGEIKRTERLEFPNGLTGNEAEYRSLDAVIRYLDAEPKRTSIPVIICTDSKLVAGQMTAGNRIKAKWAPLAVMCKVWLDAHPNVTVEWVDGTEMKKVLGH